MLKRISVFLCIFFCSINFIYAAPGFNTHVTQEMLTNQTDPKDFATLFYGLVLANEIIHSNYEKNLAALFLTAPLYSQYKKVVETAAHQNDVGCIDFSLFTGAQDAFQGFGFGKSEASNNVTSIPVYLLMNDETFKTPKPKLILQLVKTSDGWKINNIIYKEMKSSLKDKLQQCKT